METPVKPIDRFKKAINDNRFNMTTELEMINHLVNKYNFISIAQYARNQNISPPAALKPGLHFDEYYRFAEPSWNEKRINNINQHFVTAFLGTHLKQEDFSKYLDLAPDSNEKTWEGFKNRTSTGLELLHAVPE